ncbi:MAG: Asp-tRNA(Asn)/Glu-tRNA(Gln) amidotransferase subunit GatB [Patescibacteria group bacterium]|nr:MAG: Asp-tRNA(Asn)/Glu-tRNA(Gln) amidotransferase subunit GatB [Patescibacteria group bacterium]
MTLEPVIGLEIHVQLKTKSKMFCGCDNRAEDAPPNTAVCPICMGHPGTLPVANAQAINYGILASLAIGCRITPQSKFDRKNYFYPDLPKGYQISQFDKPVGVDGKMTLENPYAKGNERTVFTIGITRLHLEEDAAKLQHAEGGRASLVDFNRAGTPLAEIVTEPDFASASEAKAFLQELRLIMRTLGVSDADMEKGHLRCDANVSLRQVIDDPAVEKESVARFNPKTEVKNLNSFKAVERALEYEILRQTKLWEIGTPPMVTTTRGWDEDKQITVEQRVKEDSADYRYFPEPDLPPLELAELENAVRRTMPELPEAKRQRFREEYALGTADAKQIVETPGLADFTEQTFSELREWLSSSGEKEEWDAVKPKFAKLVSGWLLSKLLGLMAEIKTDIRIAKLTPENFAEFLTLLHAGKINSTSAQEVLRAMLESGQDPSQIVAERGLEQVSDLGDLELAVDNVILANEKVVGDYKAGKQAAIMFLVGQVMKETKGKAKPDLVREILEAKLGKL